MKIGDQAIVFGVIGIAPDLSIQHNCTIVAVGRPSWNDEFSVSLSPEQALSLADKLTTAANKVIEKFNGAAWVGPGAFVSNH